jgi:hypothetical protein
LIDKLEEDDIPGLLLLIDFEKVFDTVEWSFIDKTLQVYVLLRLEPSHIASVLSKLTLSPAHSENLLKINKD